MAFIKPESREPTYSASLTSFYRSGTCSSSASRILIATNGQLLVSAKAPSVHHDFLEFLAVCQMRGIDFLGITWDHILDDNSNVIGLGMTAAIYPSALNLDVTFAFKRFIDRYLGEAGKESPEERRHRLYRALISEVSVLGNPAIREHHNIICLQGICWDYLPNEQEELFRPVLVFEKASHGDLRQFMRSTHAVNLTVKGKLKICADIVRGIAIMHSSGNFGGLKLSKDLYWRLTHPGVIHGDIKPHNVLIFDTSRSEPQNQKDGTTKYVAKIADFGYSTCTEHDEDCSASSLVQLPWSPPWNAPEIGPYSNVVTFREAKVTDVFSLGMICLWLLFHHDKSRSGSGLLDNLDVLRSLKEGGKLTEVAWDLIDQSADVEVSMRSRIREFFDLTLSKEPSNRSQDLPHLLDLLTLDDQKSECYVTHTIAGSKMQFIVKEQLFEVRSSSFVVRQWVDHVQMKWNSIQFASYDYRLRQYIATCLEREAVKCKNTECMRNAAFQLAFCYMTGFGRSRDSIVARSWLEESDKPAGQLSVAVQIATQVTQPYKNLHIIKLISEGYLVGIDHAEVYKAQGLLEVSEVCYRREIGDMEVAFQNENVLTVLKLTLSDILKLRGQYAEATDILELLVSRVENDTGFRERYLGNSQDFKTRLADVYLKQGWNRKAMSIFQEAIVDIEASAGSQHPQTMSARLNFSQALRKVGQFQRAEVIIRSCLSEKEKALGSGHPQTINVLENLAAVLKDQGHHDEALDVMRGVLTLQLKVSGPDSTPVLLTVLNLAGAEFQIGHYAEAGKLSLDTWKKLSGIFGPDNYEALTSLETYGMSLLLQHKGQAAEIALRQALDGMRRIRPRYDHNVLRFTTSLAIDLQACEKFVEAGEVLEQIVEAQESHVVEDVATLQDLQLLATNFFQKGMYQKAEQIVNLAVQGRRQVLGEAEVRTLQSVATLVDIKLDLDQSSEAELLSRQALQNCCSAFSHQPTRLKINNGLAVALELQGKYDESVSIYNECLDGYNKLYGKLNRDTLTSLSNLGSVHLKRGDYSQAEHLYQRAFDGFQQILGPEQPYTWITKSNIACAVAKQGRLEEAQELYRAAFKGLEETCGDDHTYTRKCEQSLKLLNNELDSRFQSELCKVT